MSMKPTGIRSQCGAVIEDPDETLAVSIQSARCRRRSRSSTSPRMRGGAKKLGRRRLVEQREQLVRTAVARPRTYCRLNVPRGTRQLAQAAATRRSPARTSARAAARRGPAPRSAARSATRMRDCAGATIRRNDVGRELRKRARVIAAVDRATELRLPQPLVDRVDVAELLPRGGHQRFLIDPGRPACPSPPRRDGADRD